MSVNVTSKNFSKFKFDSSEPVLLHFADQTEISRRQEMYLKHFSMEWPHVTIGRVDTVKEPSLAAMYGIEQAPAVKIFKKGRCTASATGLQDNIHLTRLIAK